MADSKDLSTINKELITINKILNKNDVKVNNIEKRL